MLPMPENLEDLVASPLAFERIARLRLHSAPTCHPAWSPGDFDLSPAHVPATSELAALKPAAVLIPILARTPLTVLLTRRAAHLAHHPGQIAFPGGKIEPSDASPTAAALRESLEEIGLLGACVTPLGFLPTYRTGTGFSIEPLVALIDARFIPTLDPQEVAESFEVPLTFVLAAANYQTHTKTWRGVPRQYYAIPYETHYIWGATAGMLRCLQERLTQP
jgi:8-oxo-dGTP pyrophosphatase MutT (NUDIX family)